MTTIRFQNDRNEIYNDQGLQLIGTNAPNLEGGLNPKELLEASLGLCISITLHNQLRSDGTEVDLSEISIKVAAAKEGGVTSRFSHFYVDVTLPPILSPDYKEDLLKRVEKICTISNTLRISPTIEASYD